MEYVALYRKYRPKKLDEIYGQKYIVDIIKNSISTNKFMHAYLFSGPRGTGKTTIAKLLAKIVNCSNLNGFDPCDECDSCKLINDKSNPDILEIDAASNNGVDEIRTIRDSVVLMPSVSKYKVYIIDEVHMLSTSAFNALLKTLEEPPKHVIFILATTEINKVPETIVSRCQCYDFKRISVDDIVNCLTSICKHENVEISDDVLKLIAMYCNGGMRDSIGLLDKLLSYSNIINEKLFYDVVGLVDDSIIKELFNYICSGDVVNIFNLVEKLVNYGKSIELITEQLLGYLRNLSVNKSNLNISEDDFMIIVDGVSFIYNSLKDTFNQMLFFEIEILKIVNKISKEKKIISREIISDVSVNKLEVKESNNVDNIKENSKQNKQSFDNKKLNFDVVINNAFALADKSLKNEVLSKWSDFNDYVHNKEFSSLVSYFLDSSVQVVGEKDVIISVSYDSIVENVSKNIVKLELLFNLVMGKFYNLAFVSDSEWQVLKNKYVSDVKSGKSYKYIVPSEKNDDIIVVDQTNDVSDAILEAKDVFGNDIVEIK